MPGPFYFSWAGGTIVEQLTLVTNGTTHGASYETVGLVGTVMAPEQQITSLASTQELEVGAYYQLTGPGIAAGTWFVFDDTILSGLPNSLNLNQAVTGFGSSLTLQATKAISVGTFMGSMAAGSGTVVLLDAGDLPAGTYGIFGTGIGETNVPVHITDGTTETSGGGVLFIGSGYLVYDGAGVGTLGILAATPHTTTGTDEFDQPTKITTYTIAPQAVRATSGGDFPVTLSGFPTADPFSVTDIPLAAVNSLTSGLVYNISGNGIPLGTTFLAPSGGSSTSITLDLEATASDQHAILTITGPRTPNAPFNAAVHNVFDEDIVALEIAQEEGGFPTLTVDMRNPNIGLLALGRNLWCWLSWDQAWPAGPPDLVPLFNGRLVGVPKLTAGEIVQVEFLARPDDLNVQKAALAESLQVLPYYDPVWFATAVSPDTVLETYSALWHTDRTTLELTTSDILEGEAGIIAIGEDQSIYDRFSLSYGQPPLLATTVTGTVGWQQQAEGTFDVTDLILKAFAKGGSGYSHEFPSDAWGNGGGGLIQTLCGDGLKGAWPAAGTSIGGGWSFNAGTDRDGVPLCYIVEASKNNEGGGWLDSAYYDVVWTMRVPPAEEDLVQTGALSVYYMTAPYADYVTRFPLNVYKIRTTLLYQANRKRTETVTAVVTAGVQRELSDTAESDRETLSLTSEFVGAGVDPGGAMPIGDLSYRSYFQTARGARSFEYLLLAARAKMRARSRAVDISFAVNWTTALPMTLRHSVELTDRRLPGGTATGKLKSYRLVAGAQGMWGEFTIGCAIGTGETVSPQAGVVSYVDAGYVTIGWQAITGTQIPLTELAYQTLDDFIIADDGLDLTNLTATAAVNECVVVNGLAVQMPALDEFQGKVAPATGDPVTTMQGLTTQVTLDLKPVQGSEFHTEFFPAITPLALPKMIDLSGA